MQPTSEQREMVKEVTKSVLSIITLIGGGVFMYLQPLNATAVSGIMGTVIAYYFLSLTQEKAVQTTISALSAQAITQQAANDKKEAQK